MNDANRFYAIDNSSLSDRFTKEREATSDEKNVVNFVTDLKTIVSDLFNLTSPGTLKARKTTLKNIPQALRKSAQMLEKVDYETWAFAKYFDANNPEGFSPWTEAAEDLKAFTYPSKEKLVKELKALADLLEKAKEKIPATKALKAEVFLAASLRALFKSYSLPFTATKTSFAAVCFRAVAEATCLKGLTSIDDPTHYLKGALAKTDTT